MRRNSKSIFKTALIISLLFLFIKTNAQAPGRLLLKNTALQPLHRAACNNLDFSAGTTSNWEGKWCSISDTANYLLVSSDLPDIGLNTSGSVNQPDFVHEVMTTGADPYTLLSTVPPGHNYSLRLGNDKKGVFSRQVISNKFNVSASNPAITCWYAVVLEQDRSLAHNYKQRPYLKINVYDENLDLIGCSSYDSERDSLSVKSTGATDILYKNWTSFTLPLTDHIGKEVTVEIETSDCSSAQHFGYAYVAVDCVPFEITKTLTSVDSCGNLNYLLTGPNGMETYEWLDSAGSVNTQSINVHIPGKHTLYMSYTMNGVTCMTNLIIIISPHPNTVSALFSNTTACVGQATVFTDESLPKDSITAWSWDFNNDGIEDSNVQHPVYTFLTGGTYPVKLKIKKGTCLTEVKKNVFVDAAPVLVITDPIADCISNTADLTAATVTNGSTGLGTLSYWLDAAATIPLTGPAAASSGTYYIKATSVNGGCDDVKPVHVSIDSSSLANAGPDLTICSGMPGNIGAAAMPDCIYMWTPATGLSSGSVSNPAITTVNNGSIPLVTIYQLTVTNTSSGCTTSDSVMVTVDPLFIVNAGATQTVCAGSSVQLNGTVSDPAVSASWSGGTGTYSPDQKSLKATYTPSQAEYDAGFVKLTLTVNTPAGACPPAAADLIINFYKNALQGFTVSNPGGCPLHCVQFSAATIAMADSVVSWQWDFGDQSIAGTTKNVAHCYTRAGDYDVTLTTLSAHGCKAVLTKPQMIQVQHKPVAEFSSAPNPVSEVDPEVIFTDQSSPDAVYWHYSFGDGDTIGNNIPNPRHFYPKVNATTYVATLIVKNKAGCKDTISHEVAVKPAFTFFIPNAFTPNDDGDNDLFLGEGVGIAKYDLSIFDRWGNLIFHTEDLNEGWNGKANNGPEKAQQETYVWKATITDIFRKGHHYTGTVTLLK